MHALRFLSVSVAMFGALALAACDTAVVPGGSASAPSSAEAAPARDAEAVAELGLSYRYINLTPGVYATADDLNSRGRAVGQQTVGFNSFSAFAWQNGRLVDFGTRFGIGNAQAVGDDGRVVGSFQFGAGEPFRAYLFQRGVVTDLGTGSSSGSSGSIAFDVNSAGQVVGSRREVIADPEFPSEAVLWQDGEVIQLGTLGGVGGFSPTSVANAINEQGQIVGDARVPFPEFQPYHPFVWESGVMRDIDPELLSGQATDVNDRGIVVGRASVNGEATTAHRWDLATSQRRSLGTLGGANSSAYGLNERGQVVGTSGISVSNGLFNHAFVWERGRMVDLNTVTQDLPADVVLESAQAINDDGWIVGNTCTLGGIFCSVSDAALTHAYLLIPEPIGESAQAEVDRVKAGVAAAFGADPDLSRRAAKTEQEAAGRGELRADERFPDERFAPLP